MFPFNFLLVIASFFFLIMKARIINAQFSKNSSDETKEKFCLVLIIVCVCVQVTHACVCISVQARGKHLMFLR